MTAIGDFEYRCPRDLMVNDIQLRRLVVIGSCLAEGLPITIKSVAPHADVDFFLFNNVGALPDKLPCPVDAYDFQIVQIPLRSVLPDTSLSRLRYDDTAAYENLFENAAERVRIFLSHAMKWNIEHGMTTFIFNFLKPQQNPLGRLLPRYDLRNPVYFVEKLNQLLAEEISHYRNAFFFDFDQVVDTFGRRYFSDDVITALNHAAAAGDWGYSLDTERLEPIEPITAYYPMNSEILKASIGELLAMYRTIRRNDEVKLVVVDVDDTLWRGVAAEQQDVSPAEAYEGWPLGVSEALGFLKQRGILLAMLSKNDDEKLVRLWEAIIRRRLPLADFAVRKVNWRPKVENFAAILEETNLLSRNALYIDDNPVERAAIKAAYPDVRVLGPNPYLWRRILLWAPETQVAQITGESAKRTEMVQAQVRRETERKVMSRADFLLSLDLQVTLWQIDGVDHPQFARSLELINKTNQFNTTGRRWTMVEASDFLRGGGHFYAFDAADKFTGYGTIGVAVLGGSGFEQFVMSCRVIGMDVEIAAVAAIVGAQRAEGGKAIRARFTPTDANALCEDLFARAGFELQEQDWLLGAGKPLEIPAHIMVRYEAPAKLALLQAE